MEKCPHCEGDVFFYDKENEYVCVSKFGCGWRGMLEKSGNSHFDFYNKVCENFPFLIAHEYYQLSQLVKKQKIYGALLQLRDVFEVTIKLPTLTAISILRSKNEYDPTIFSRLLFSSLNLGDWYELANLCGNLKNNLLPTELKQLLKSICKLFKNKRQDVCEWRNSKIGHGALNIDEHYCWEQLILPYIQSLNAHYIANEALYTSLNYVDANRYTLVGKDSFENLKSIFVEDSQLVEMFPYVYADEEGVFLFDTYYSNKKKVAMLNYPNGIKREYKNEIYNKLTNDYQYIRKNGVFEQQEKHVIDTTLSQSDIDQLYEIQKVNDFIKPPYCQQYVQNIIDNYSKGIFLLQMEQGMGKTTFAQALDELALNKIKLKNASIRGYYFNNTFASDVKYFLEHVIDMLRSNSYGKLDIKRVASTQIQSPEEWIELINAYYEAHVKHFYAEKMVLIFDGLDEINANEKAIWDFICITESMKQILNDNIYIFYTCRTNSEISNATQQYLNTISFTHPPLQLTREAADYKEILKLYLKKKNSEQLLPITNGRFSEVHLVAQLAESGLAVNDESSIFTQYMNYLEQQYDKKFMRQLIEVILLITYAKEPITIEEIAFALQEPISLKLLGYIYDLRPILSVRQHQNRHVLSLSNDSWIVSSKEYFAGYLDGFIGYLMEFDKDYEPESIDVLDEDAEFLSFIYSNYGELFLTKLNESDQIAAMKMMHHIALMFNENNLYTYRWNRSESMMQLIIDQPTHTRERIILKIDAYNQLANTAYKRRQLKLALKRITEIFEWIRSISWIHPYSLIKILDTKLKITFELKLYNEVQEVLDKLEILQRSEGNLLYVLELKRNIATFKVSINEPKVALSLIKPVIKQIECKNEFENSDEVILLANCYETLRDIYIHLEMVEKAIEASNKAMEVLEIVRSMSVDKYEANAINIFHNNGDIYYKSGKYKEALQGYTLSIELLLKFKKNDQFVDYEKLVDSLRWRLECYIKLNDIESQLNDLQLICKYSRHVTIVPFHLCQYYFLMVRYQNGLNLFSDMQESIPALIAECENLDLTNEDELNYFSKLIVFSKCEINNQETKQLFLRELLPFIKHQFNEENYETIVDYLNEA